MARKNGRVVHALFQSVGDDGTMWLFVIHAENKWSITRNGEPIDVGPADRMGVGGGVKRFLQLSARREAATRGRPRLTARSRSEPSPSLL